MCIYLHNDLREWWRGNENDGQEQLNNRNNETEQEVQIEMDHIYGEDLEEKLERFYIKLLEEKSNRRRNNIN